MTQFTTSDGYTVAIMAVDEIQIYRSGSHLRAKIMKTSGHHDAGLIWSDADTASAKAKGIKITMLRGF